MIFALRNANGGVESIIFILFSLVAVFIALVLHEVAHGLVALWSGDPTAKNSGRISLNPVRHFDMTGFIMMALVGFGYAKPVPVNPYNFRHYKRGMFGVAIAGICTNILLAFTFSLFYCLGIYGLINAEAEGAQNFFYYLAYFFLICIQVNLSFAFFNLLPIHPLDGYRIIEAFTRRGNRFCTFMRTNGQYILFGLVGLHLIVSMAFRYASLPYWFQYFDILGTYINFFVSKLAWVFTHFWGLMIPGVV